MENGGESTCSEDDQAVAGGVFEENVIIVILKRTKIPHSRLERDKGKLAHDRIEISHVR